jgi:hypothetical protein
MAWNGHVRATRFDYPLALSCGCGLGIDSSDFLPRDAISATWCVLGASASARQRASATEGSFRHRWLRALWC